MELARPSLILGIEEPELYQHPNRQRHLARILLRLASGHIKGVANTTQVIYTIHSPLFIDIERYEQVRLLRKERIEENRPKQTQVRSITWNQIARLLESAQDRGVLGYRGDTLTPRMVTLMTPWMNEGFFADVAVLVEGPEDRAAILGLADCEGEDLESLGITVIPCMGKSNLDRPYAVFRSLGIPVYLIWDGDQGNEQAKPETNHCLLRLLGEPCEDWPERVEQRFACFKTDLGQQLALDVGEELYSHLLDDCRNKLGMRKKDAMKNPVVISEIIARARCAGRTCFTLGAILKNVLAMASREVAFSEGQEGRSR